MRRQRNRVMNARRFVLAVLFGLVWSGAALAETYPARPVRVVGPFPPGGPSDVLARVITQKLTESFSQQFYVDNHGGAGGTIGAGLVSHSPADGYTLLFGSTTILAVSPTLYPNLPSDPPARFAPLGLFASVPLSLVVNRELPVSSVPELIAYVRARPGKLFYGSARHRTPPPFPPLPFHIPPRPPLHPPPS